MILALIFLVAGLFGVDGVDHSINHFMKHVEGVEYIGMDGTAVGVEIPGVCGHVHWNHLIVAFFIVLYCLFSVNEFIDFPWP